VQEYLTDPGSYKQHQDGVRGAW
jgi:tetratricopeptide (TPR) repeat protein